MNCWGRFLTKKLVTAGRSICKKCILSGKPFCWVNTPTSEHLFLRTQIFPLPEKHFQQWMKLFKETLDENFKGENAEEAKFRAAKMAQMFESKIAYYRNRGSGGLV